MHPKQTLQTLVMVLQPLCPCSKSVGEELALAHYHLLQCLMLLLLTRPIDPHQLLLLKNLLLCVLLR
jgi:hypothetical protein